MRLGIDFSQWGGPLAPETVACWDAQGVRWAGPQYSFRLPQHLETLYDSPATIGWDIDVYVYLYWHQQDYYGTPTERIKRAAAMCAGYPISRLWIDCEEAAAGLSPAQLAAFIREAEIACYEEGFEAGIYTGRWWWVANMADSRAFGHLPLWDANYIGQPPVFDAFRPYGGWDRPLVWQYHDTTSFCGHSVDLNALEDTAPAPAPVLEDEDVKHVTITAAERGDKPFRSYLIGATLAGGLGSHWVASAEEFHAIDKARIAGALTVIPLADLRQYHPDPDPLA